MQEGKLFVFSAPSGSGKTTLVQHLLDQKLPLGFSISATSREPRGAEINGVDYHFLSLTDFQKKIGESEFVEYEEVYTGVFYGTLKSELQRLWAEGKHVLFDIDVKGGLRIKEQFPDQTLALFIQPPSKEALEKRLRGRGTEDEKAIKMRLARAEEELSFAPQFDTVIINDDLETAKKQVVLEVKKFMNL
jgi:guanylate kinase